MAQTLFTGQTPDVSGDDGAPGITTATTIRSTVDGTATAIRFYTGPIVGGTYTGLLWERLTNDTGGGGTGDELASEAFIGTPDVSAWNEIPLVPPVPITAGITYRVGIHNPTRYVATNDFFTGPLVNGDLIADENGETGVHLGLVRQGTFLIDAAPGYPTQVGDSASYFVDIVFEPGTDPADGSAALGLDLAVATTGARDSEGAAALGLNLAVAAIGARPAQGSAALTLNLAVSGSGLRAVSGTAALGLNLAVSASGSNGQSGRPVTPWPGTVVPVSSYPWTPRPVRSFQEVDQP